uniref:F-box/LRR-repeat protein 15/At3g58940/PEG3-like LRR domain-containing protein n=1 Tax=Oryza brachyantha TaxID=4533 RepID=J3MSN0_ORYBR
MDELGIIEEGVDWRFRLGQDIRNRVTHDIMFTLQMKLQTAAFTTLTDLQKVAARIEERIHTIAIDYGDYLRRISLIKGDLEDSYPVLLNNFMHIRQQASTPSFFLLHQKNKQGKIIQAEGNIQGASSSSHKEPSHPCGKDRISELPNDLIHHIMSFLSMREAARTTVLSRWWCNRWTFLQHMKIDIDWFHMDRVKFSAYVDKILLRRDRANAPMDTFQLDSFAIDRASSWIHHAIKHNAKVVKFSEYERWEPFYLDPQLVGFSSQYLTTLELINADIDEMVFDPLNNACPALENLLLKDCLMDVQAISSDSLKNLDIIGCSLLKNISISTPSLVSLRIKDQRMANSSSRNSYLTFTTITLIDASNVTCMELSAIDRQFTFVEQDGSGPMFRNLRRLHLGEWCIADRFSPLRRYVQHSPMLKSVFLKLSLTDWRFELTTDQLTALVEISRGGVIFIDF